MTPLNCPIIDKTVDTTLPLSHVPARPPCLKSLHDCQTFGMYPGAADQGHALSHIDLSKDGDGKLEEDPGRRLHARANVKLQSQHLSQTPSGALSCR